MQKGFPNRFINGREKSEQTNKQTNKHFRIYISRLDIDQSICGTFQNLFLIMTDKSCSIRLGHKILNLNIFKRKVTHIHFWRFGQSGCRI